MHLASQNAPRKLSFSHNV